ncbi:MAG: hypothetical protein AB1757_23320 [Acidobacteriota bacterium]
MSADDSLEASENRRRQLYIDDEDVTVRVLNIAEGDYECVEVNTAWYERSLLEGDIILIALGEEPEAEDIVLIEEDGQTRLGIASAPDYLLTQYGPRMLEPNERIIGVGRALIRRLRRPQ